MHKLKYSCWKKNSVAFRFHLAREIIDLTFTLGCRILYSGLLPEIYIQHTASIALYYFERTSSTALIPSTDKRAVSKAFDYFKRLNLQAVHVMTRASAQSISSQRDTIPQVHRTTSQGLRNGACHHHTEQYTFDPIDLQNSIPLSARYRIQLSLHKRKVP